MIRVLLVAEDPLARAGLAALLRELASVTVIGERTVSTIGTSFAGVDAIVWDLGTQPANALARLERWDEEAPPVIALVPDEESAAEAGHAGARGVLSRSIGSSALEAAIRAVNEGLFVSDEGLGRVRAHLDAPVPPLLGELTPREIEVLKLLAEGLSNKAIAQRLEISEHTAKFHVNAILQKLGVERRTEAVVRAARLGLVML